MFPVSQSEWVQHARRFVALGNHQALQEAASVCADPKIKAFLENPGAWQSLAARLRRDGRIPEAGVVELIGIRAQANAVENIERLDPRERDAALAACNRAAAVSHEFSFAECEARFLAILGGCAAKLRSFPQAVELLNQSLAIRRRLAVSDPPTYLPILAVTLNNLGAALAEHRGYEASRRALDEALGIYRQLSASRPSVYLPVVANTCVNLENVLTNLRELIAARSAGEEALQILGDLDQAQPERLRPALAVALSAHGSTLRQFHQLLEARRSLEQAHQIYRQLAESEPRAYQVNLAKNLHNLGNVLTDLEEWPAAQSAFDEARRNFEQLAAADSGYRPLLAATLDSLGSALSREGHWPLAQTMLERALDLRRLFAKSQSSYRADVSTTLNTLGIVREHLLDLDGARKAYEEARDIRRELAASAPRVYKPELAMTLNNLAGILEAQGSREESARVSRESVEQAESDAEDPRELWLAKAKAAGAFKHWLGVVAAQGTPDSVFRALAAFREGPVRALGESPAEGLAAAVESLRRVSESIGRPVCILAAQSLHRSAQQTNADLLLAVLDSRADPPLRYERASAFAERAYALFTELQSIFDPTRRRDGCTWQRCMAELGSSAWAALPDPLRDLLDPRSGVDVLISGDTYWAAFPWEALRYGSAVEDYLGWTRPLARWGPLTAAAISRLARHKASETSKRIEVICPWDADPRNLLYASLAEAQSLGRDLPAFGFELAPTGPAIGANANLAAMTAAVLSRPTVLHYTGHGGIVENEEVLVLHGKPFGRTELHQLKQRQGITARLFASGSLVALNSCLTGRKREYGGQREDLAGIFLEEGADGVVASALPVFDPVGQVLGTALYSLPGASGMGVALQQIRRVIGRLAARNNAAEFPTWSMLQYHGNPYVGLSPGPARPGSAFSPGLVEAVRSWLGALTEAQASAQLLEAMGSA